MLHESKMYFAADHAVIYWENDLSLNDTLSGPFVYLFLRVF